MEEKKVRGRQELDIMEGKKAEIIVGTNEEFILGYEVTTDKDGKVHLKQSFADHSHTGSVRQVAITDKFLASGSTDEVIRIFDLHTRTSVGFIMEHCGTITDLAFHGSKYLFSAAEDGNICIFQKDKWKCEKTFQAHDGGVTSLAVHPTGKLALSVGRDKKLRTWNLINGMRAYITNIKTVADSVHWSPPGTHYLLVKGSCVDVYEVASGQVTHSVDFKECVRSLIFVTDDIIAVGGEGKNVCLYDIKTEIELFQWTAHSMRVKSLHLIPQEAAERLWLVSASSDGTIKVWGLELLSLSSAPKLLGEVDTTCRITCMDIYLPCQEVLKTSALATDDVENSDRGDTGDVSTTQEKEVSSQKNGVQLKRKRKKNKKRDSGEPVVNSSSRKLKKAKSA